jgi:hypothetical protein
LDLDFNPIFFRWLCGHQKCLTQLDVSQLDPALNRTYEALINIVKNKELIDIDSSLTNEERKTEIEALKIDGSTI